LEEMPVQETIDGIAELTAQKLPIGNVILNLVRPPLLAASTRTALESGTVTVAAVAKSLTATGLDAAAAPDLIAGGVAHVKRQELQEGQRDILVDCGRPLVELPSLPDGIDLGALFELGEILKSSGMA